ncbi:hypothetical protein MESS2_80054 [Mesorhizobium metallidurans STM 2683]|uniref:Uncharacterized protein n=1 Tax=Mesorhizobium metallidurans STM 2683 TaxID=1297569 RepID=M5EY42_9HYPH|nr:hypothetical protein MESS2_80054 [Mesorhizobium metallidurans STM 2683]
MEAYPPPSTALCRRAACCGVRDIVRVRIGSVFMPTIYITPHKN